MILAILLAACEIEAPTPTAMPPAWTAVPPTQPVVQPSPALAALPTPADVPVTDPSPAQPSPQPLPAYSLNAVYAYSTHTLTVSEQITYTNLSTQAFDRLLLVVEANRYPGSLQIQSIQADGQALEGYTLERNRLDLPLLYPLEPGATTRLELDYILVLPEIPASTDTNRSQPYGFTSRQANLVDWYPYIPIYQEETGWLAPEPGYFAEHQVFPLEDFQVSLLIPEIGSPLIVAASAPAVRQGEMYQYTLPGARSFAISISPLYRMLSGKVGDIIVYSYFFTFDSTGGQAVLDHTLQAVALYQELFGPYPHQSLSVVQADFLDGMEFDGLYFLSRGFYGTYDGTPCGYLTTIAVHETAHQWWYGLVGNNQAFEPWLDEALCTYAERLYYERYYPDLLSSWWWPYRVNYYAPSGPVNGTIYDYPSFRTYRDAVYLNGALMLEAMRQQMGDEAFLAALRDYASRFNGQQSTAADFINTLGAHTTQDLTPILTQFFK